MDTDRLTLAIGKLTNQLASFMKKIEGMERRLQRLEVRNPELAQAAKEEGFTTDHLFEIMEPPVPL